MRLAALPALAVAAGLVLAGCSSASDTGSTDSSAATSGAKITVVAAENF